MTVQTFIARSVLATALVLAPLTSPAQVSINDLVRVEVRVQSDNDRKDIKGATADTVTQNKTLQIAISGKPKTPETRTGKWTVYGRDLKGKDLSVLGSGDFKLDLAQGPQKTESTKVSTTSTAAHAVISKSGSGRTSRSSVKKVEGDGMKYVGYLVVIRDGDKVVGSAADPSGMQTEAAK